MIMISEEPLMHIAICDDNIADRKQLERLLTVSYTHLTLPTIA